MIPQIAPGLHGTLSIVELTGATYRQVNYWVAKGYINPLPVHVGSKERPQRGTGNRMIFDAHEVKVAWLMNHLVENQGASPERAANLARGLAQDEEVTLGALTIRVSEASP